MATATLDPVALYECLDDEARERYNVIVAQKQAREKESHSLWLSEKYKADCKQMNTALQIGIIFLILVFLFSMYYTSLALFPSTMIVIFFSLVYMVLVGISFYWLEIYLKDVD